MSTTDPAATARVEAPEPEVRAPEAPLSNPAPGLPWVIGIFVGATVSYVVLRLLFDALEVGPTPLMSIGTMLIGAAIATTFALAAYKPFDRIDGANRRATIILFASLILAFAFWTLFSGTFNYSMELWSFPIIGTVWWFIAATSFVGEDAHVAQIDPGRRTALNALLWIAGTWLIIRTFVWIPPFWFGFVQTLLVTGGFAYLLRRVTQPAKSLYAWAVLAFLTAVAILVSTAFDVWDTTAQVGPWAIGGPTPQWGIFFGLWCGLNYGVLACIQCWPFSRIRQPWGTITAVLAVIAWCIVIGRIALAIFDGVEATHDAALLETQVWAWHTVFWGFCFALLYGIGSSPYVWVGQRTPGTWDDVD